MQIFIGFGCSINSSVLCGLSSGSSCLLGTEGPFLFIPFGILLITFGLLLHIFLES